VVWQLQWMRYLGYDPIYMIPVFPCCIYVSYRYALAVRAFDALAIEWLSYLWYGGYSGYVIWVMTQYIRYRSFLAAYMLVTVMLTRSLSCPCLCPSKIFDRIGVERRLCSNSTLDWCCSLFDWDWAQTWSLGRCASRCVICLLRDCQKCLTSNASLSEEALSLSG
jgi:hypothetical protein